MNAIKSLLASEKALFVGLLIIAATVLCAIGKMTVDAWISYTEFMAVTYVGGKTIQGTAAVLKNGKPSVSDVDALKAKIANNDAAADAAAKKLP